MTTGPYAWVASVVAHTDASAITAPTERSMPPPMITNVMPTVMTPIVEASARTLTMFEEVAKFSGAVTRPTTARRISATTRPR